MTIQRRYSLPNCSLVLEGLGDLAVSDKSYNRPAMSILVNAECRLPRLPEPISGGRQFLESLIRSVSSYTQELLSGISQPVSKEGEALNLVTLKKGSSSDSHLLSVYPEPQEGIPVSGNPTRQVELTTVELFDILEAIDQLLADSSTLPDLSLSLQPVSKRYAATHNSLNKRLKPIALGLTGLAIAGISSYLLPVPKVEKPKPAPIAKSTASPVPQPPTANNTPSQAEIKDAKTVQSLIGQVNNKLGNTWTNKSKIKEDLVYQLNVDAKGQVVNYQGINQIAASSASQTSLPSLVSKAPNAVSNSVPVAKLKAVFKPNGAVQVSPWNQ